MTPVATSSIKYNIVENDGQRESVTAFINGKPYMAQKLHKNFAAICNALESGKAAKTVRDLFDVTETVAEKFHRLSERVSVKSGRIYFDNVEVDNVLTTTIVNFLADGQEDFMPLVNFMEKIETNPNPHSREHLFRWLAKWHFAIAPDGDFIAYKGLGANFDSVNAGTAIVNGVEIEGRIPNKPDTVIEMPRDKVQFDPKVGCSTGLHAGNWSYASSFAQGKLVRVKINPRDVVSVPVDSSDQKLRVCRYRVLAPVTSEDKTMLYVGIERTRKVEPKQPKKRTAPASKKPAVKKPAVKSRRFPQYYEKFSREDFEATNLSELRWLAREWGCKAVPRTKAALVTWLVAAAKRRLKTW